MVSPRSAQIALTALGVAVRLAAPRRNGLPLPADLQTAFRELHEATIPTAGAADGIDSGVSPRVVERFEWIDTAEAARRSGVAGRTVRQRLARGRLPGRKVGRTWMVEWQQEAS
jgi:hypothetical protein